jgi:hypothetical protein
MAHNLRRKTISIVSALTVGLLSGCSSAVNAEMQASGLTANQCGVITEVQPRIMDLMFKFGSVLSEDLETRKRAIWDSGYENMQAYFDDLNEEASKLSSIAASENVTEDEAAVLNALVDAIYEYESHWPDQDGTELMNSQQPVNAGQYEILDLCM